MSGCVEPGCERQRFGHGLCNMHYQRSKLRDRRATVIPDGEKLCPGCDSKKAFSEFARHAGCKDGFRPECKECTSNYQRAKRPEYAGSVSRRYSLKKNFGITVEQYDQMLADQDGRCKICGSDKSTGRWDTGFLCVDHDHETGKIRGLLCSTCNSGLGMFKDNLPILESAVKYLKQGRN